MEYHSTGCLICGDELKYEKDLKKMSCSVCNESFDSNASCVNGHFICDNCHGLEAYGYIEKYAVNTNSTDPLETAVAIMHNKTVKMHGPEHHYLVPAVLLSAYYNKNNDIENKKKKIAEARKRSEKVPGGYCGFYGSCGAGIGTGIFISLITGATPLSSDEWKLANRMTSKSLLTISDKGGPRCCKRDTFLAIIEAVKFLKKNFKTELPINENVKCDFSSINRECLKDKCDFFKKIT